MLMRGIIKSGNKEIYAFVNSSIKQINKMILLKDKDNKRAAYAVLFIVFLCALALRLYGINKCDFWYDELISDRYSFDNITKVAAHHGSSVFSYFFNIARNDQHSFFYYLLVYAYSFFFGGDKSLRLLSVIFSMLSLGIFYRFARIFYNRWNSIGAILIMGLSPFHIWYAQEARGYAMSCFFAISLAYFYMRALQKDNKSRWAYFIIAAIFAVYSSYYAVFLIIVSGIIILLKDNRKSIRMWLLSIPALLLALSPLFYIFIKQIDFVKTSSWWWISEPSYKAIIFTFAVFNLGYSASLIQHYICLALFFILFIRGINSYYQYDKTKTYIMLLFAMLPIILIGILSILTIHIYIDRQLLMFSPFYYLLVARGISGIKDRAYRIFTVVSVALILLMSLIGYYRGFIVTDDQGRVIYPGIHVKKEYSALMESINKDYQYGDLIATTDPQAFIVTSLYLKRHGYGYLYEKVRFLFYSSMLEKSERGFFRINDPGDNRPMGDKSEPSILFFSDGKKILEEAQYYINKFKRVWLVSSSWDINSPLSLNSTSVKKYMDDNYKMLLSKERDGFYLYLYSL